MKTHMGQTGLVGIFGLILPILPIGIHQEE